MEPLFPDCVSEFEEREAAVYGNYNWMEWRQLPIEERATAVAQYRMRRLLDLHAEDAVTQAAERLQGRRAKRNG